MNELNDLIIKMGLYIGIIASIITIILGIRELILFISRKNKQNKNQYEMTPDVTTLVTKQRHIFTSFCIVLMFVISLFVSVPIF